MNPFDYKSFNYTTAKKADDKQSFSDNSDYEYYDTTHFFIIQKTTWDGLEGASPWKIHLSINPEDLAKAWDLIAKYLNEQGVPSYKVSILSRVADGSANLDNVSHKSMERVYNGNQITIYLDDGDENRYNEILEEVERILTRAKIRPGTFDENERKIGVYTSIRAPGRLMDEEHPYLADQQALDHAKKNQTKPYNPYNFPDPFAEIQLPSNRKLNVARSTLAGSILGASITSTPVIVLIVLGLLSFVPFPPIALGFAALAVGAILGAAIGYGISKFINRRSSTNHEKDAEKILGTELTNNASMTMVLGGPAVTATSTTSKQMSASSLASSIASAAPSTSYPLVDEDVDDDDKSSSMSMSPSG